MSAPQQIGTLKQWASGIPKSLHRGATIRLTMSYTQKSRDVLAPTGFALSLWNFAAPGFKQMQGISAKWWDPVHHRWEKASYYESNGLIGLNLPGYSPTVKVASGKVGHVYLQVTFSKTAYTGTWHFEPMVSGYWLLTSKGTYDNNYLGDSRSQYTSTLRP
ncbi:hypothetical protein [Streptomyces silvisoli]|uniref:Uncharacterized protein n=1 Tax=Streptomyces silvisoli TaxID=3034235 RepID=A0ABT5ZT46_9ACTN|nr:hypothetical protein [Streptomyces silvisoli]MDF3292993.1 hypothetical protein [Streptomyces silvisoli]